MSKPYSISPVVSSKASSPLSLQYIFCNENDVLFSNDTGKLGKINSECSYQESNLRPSDYYFGCSTTELQETRGS